MEKYRTWIIAGITAGSILYGYLNLSDLEDLTRQNKEYLEKMIEIDANTEKHKNEIKWQNEQAKLIAKKVQKAAEEKLKATAKANAEAAKTLAEQKEIFRKNSEKMMIDRINSLIDSEKIGRQHVLDGEFIDSNSIMAKMQLDYEDIIKIQAILARKKKEQLENFYKDESNQRKEIEKDHYNAINIKKTEEKSERNILINKLQAREEKQKEEIKGFDEKESNARKIIEQNDRTFIEILQNQENSERKILTAKEEAQKVVQNAFDEINKNKKETKEAFEKTKKEAEEMKQTAEELRKEMELQRQVLEALLRSNPSLMGGQENNTRSIEYTDNAASSIENVQNTSHNNKKNKSNKRRNR